MTTNTQLTPANVTHVGQKVTVCYYTDRRVFQIVKVSPSGKQITLRECLQTLDREASALTFTPGGFAAHVSGTQVWKVESDLNGYVMKANFSTKLNKFKTDGNTVINGSHPHYDYNF